MPMTSKQLAQSFIEHHAGTSTGTDLLFSDLDNVITRWLDGLERDAARRASDDLSDLAAHELVSSIRGVNRGELEWRVRYSLNPNDAELWTPAGIRQCPVDVWQTERINRFGQRPADEGIFSAGASR